MCNDFIYYLGERNARVKKWMLGSHYIEGIWVGYNQIVSTSETDDESEINDEDKIMYTIRWITQSLAGVTRLETKAYRADGTIWRVSTVESLAYKEDEDYGRLSWVTNWQNVGMQGAIMRGGYVSVDFRCKKGEPIPSVMTGHMVYFSGHKDNERPRITCARKISSDVHEHTFSATLHNDQALVAKAREYARESGIETNNSLTSPKDNAVLML